METITNKRVLASVFIAVFIVATLGATSVFADTGSGVAVKEVSSYAAGQTLNKTKYFKFTANKNGAVQIATFKMYSKVTLLNSAKNAISSEKYINPADRYTYGRSLFFGVKKGKTYYLKIRTGKKLLPKNYLKVTIKGIKEKSGRTKAKAVSIAKSITNKGYIAAGNNVADWYKFKTGSHKTNLKLRTYTNDKIYVVIYHKKGSVSLTKILKGDRIRNNITWNVSGNAADGTYYLKVYGKDGGSSGYYTLNWK